MTTPVSIARVWRSAGRGTLSVVIHSVVIFLLFPFLYGQAQEKYTIRCAKGKSETFTVQCPNFRTCAILAHICIDKFGKIAHLTGDERRSTEQILEEAFELPDDSTLLSELDIELASEEAEKRLVVYPNPTSSGWMDVQLRDATAYEVMVVGEAGAQPVVQEKVEGSMTKVYLPKRGRYVLIVQEGKQVWGRLLLRE